MTGLVVILVVLAAVVGAAVVAGRRNRRRQLERQEAELAPVRQLAFEDITALGVELQTFDTEMAGHELDAGANADYQRALDAYESAKTAGDRITEPDDIRDITQILDDGRYAIACVRARVNGDALPTRRPPCFFDPRHGMSVQDVSYTPVGGIERDVPACALDAERVAAGADPDVRQVLVGAKRVPYWEGGRAYEPYATGYFGTSLVTSALFAGLLFGGMGGYGGDYGGGDYGGSDGGGDGGGDAGGFDGFDGFDAGGFDGGF